MLVNQLLFGYNDSGQDRKLEKEKITSKIWFD